MTAEILEIPEVRQRISPLSVEEYHRLGEFNENGKRTELIRGIVIEKMSKSPLHSILGSRLYRQLLPQIPDGFSIWKEEPLTFVDSEPEPDIAITRGREQDYAEAHPTTAELVIEIAVSSAALDRANSVLYAEAGIKEYWIVLGRDRKIEVYRRPENGRYLEQHLFGEADNLQCSAIPAVLFRVADLFA